MGLCLCNQENSRMPCVSTFCSFALPFLLSAYVTSHKPYSPVALILAVVTGLSKFCLVLVSVFRVLNAGQCPWPGIVDLKVLRSCVLLSMTSAQVLRWL